MYGGLVSLNLAGFVGSLSVFLFFRVQHSPVHAAYNSGWRYKNCKGYSGETGREVLLAAGSTVLRKLSTT